MALAPWLYTLALFVIWEAAVLVFQIPVFFLPPPTAIAAAIYEYWPAIYRNSLITLWSTVVGFLLAVGFGLKNRADVEFVRGKADVAVVGSESLRVFNESGLRATTDFIRSLTGGAGPSGH